MMDYTVNEVLQFTSENDVKFVRLAFCDIFGVQKNISIMPEELPRAFQNGITFDASAVRGFMNVEESDLALYPDSSTLSILPWRPQHGRVIRLFCDIKHPNGKAFEGDGRNILRQAVKAAKEMGYECKIGSECEFYLFELDEKGEPTKVPHDQGTYCDIAPLDKGENVRREICLTLEEMGIIPESSHHEQGPGQNEIDFKYSNALSAADHLITFKSVVKTIAARHGLFASFMPKPLPNKSGNGLHINLSLFKNGLNLFDISGHTHCPEAESFIAGIMNRTCEMSAFLNPLTNSYARLGKDAAPKYVTWSHQNRSQLVRIPAATGEYARMELRLPDPSCNPYIAFALLIYAGLEGIKNNMPLEKPSDFNLYAVGKDKLETLSPLPENLECAIENAKKSAFIKAHLPQATFDKFIKTKEEEWQQYKVSTNKEQTEDALYFKLI
jgi:glutamine synthetase